MVQILWVDLENQLKLTKIANNANKCTVYYEMSPINYHVGELLAQSSASVRKLKVMMQVRIPTLFDDPTPITKCCAA